VVADERAVAVGDGSDSNASGGDRSHTTDYVVIGSGIGGERAAVVV
jgi:hypothetical protein